MSISVPVSVGIDYAHEVSQVVVLDAKGRQVGSRRMPSDAAKIVAYAGRQRGYRGLLWGGQLG